MNVISEVYQKHTVYRSAVEQPCKPWEYTCSRVELILECIHWVIECNNKQVCREKGTRGVPLLIEVVCYSG